MNLVIDFSAGFALFQEWSPSGYGSKLGKSKSSKAADLTPTASGSQLLETASENKPTTVRIYFVATFGSIGFNVKLNVVQ